MFKGSRLLAVIDVQRTVTDHWLTTDSFFPTGVADIVFLVIFTQMVLLGHSIAKLHDTVLAQW